MLLSLLGAFSSAETKCLVLLKGLQILYSISRDIIFCNVLPIVSLCIYTSHILISEHPLSVATPESLTKAGRIQRFSLL